MSAASPSTSQPTTRLGLRGRIAILGLVFSAEFLPMSIQAEATPLSAAPWRFWHLGLSKYVAAFVALYALHIAMSARDRLADWADEVRLAPIAWPVVPLHALAAAFTAISSVWLRSASDPTSATVAAVLRLACAASAVWLGASIFFPRRLQAPLLRRTRRPLLVIALLLAVAWLGNSQRARIWDWAAESTFGAVEFTLRPLVPNLIVDPAHRILGTPRFKVRVADTCSGIEGMGIMLAFCLAYVCLHSRRCRPAVLAALVPATLAALYAANALRIAALVMLGASGASAASVALFHSDAGWVALMIVGLGFVKASETAAPWATTFSSGSRHTLVAPNAASTSN